MACSSLTSSPAWSTRWSSQVSTFQSAIFGAYKTYDKFNIYGFSKKFLLILSIRLPCAQLRPFRKGFNNLQIPPTAQALNKNYTDTYSSGTLIIGAFPCFICRGLANANEQRPAGPLFAPIDNCQKGRERVSKRIWSEPAGLSAWAGYALIAFYLVCSRARVGVGVRMGVGVGMRVSVGAGVCVSVGVGVCTKITNKVKVATSKRQNLGICANK